MREVEDEEGEGAGDELPEDRSRRYVVELKVGLCVRGLARAKTSLNSWKPRAFFRW